MPAKQQTKKTTQADEKKVDVEKATVAEPKVEKVSKETAPAKATRGAKTTAPKVASPVKEAPKEVAPTKAAPAKRGAKTAAAPKVASPVKETPKVEAAPTKRAASSKGVTKAVETADTTPLEQPKAAPAKRTRKPKEETSESDEEDSKGKRTFHLVVDSVQPKVEAATLKKGSYSGNNPAQAAKKCFSHICREAVGGDAATFSFVIKESTKGSDMKEHSYTGERVKLDTPHMIERKDKATGKVVTSYPVHFTNKLKSNSTRRAAATA